MMAHVPFLDELAIIAAISVAVTLLLAKLKLPTVTGLLAAGAIVGPHGLKLVTSAHAIEVLAEVGVVLLLFTIGLELPLARLTHIFRHVALGGLLQVGVTTAAAFGVGVLLGQPTGRALFYGFVFALSSTAIVLRALGERNELDAPHGRFILGTLIFQDLCVVPMVLLVPMLGPGAQGSGAGTGLAIAGLKAALVVAGTIVIAKLVVPKILGWVDASRSREVFLLAMLALCIGTAWLTALAGLSLALGAFLGGVVVAETEYKHRAMGDMLPLRDAFVSVFFVSLGMLFDARVVVEEPVWTGALLLGFLLGKGVLATLAAQGMRFPARASWLAGVGLAQFGEFGFVLTKLAQTHGVIEAEAVRPLFAAGVLSMFLTPLLVRAAPHITAGERLLAPLERLLRVRSIDAVDDDHPPPKEHVLIIGFGFAGQSVARALRSSEVPFIVLEMNAENVRLGKEMGLPVYYGDATSEEALSHAGAANARLCVLLINDPQGAIRIVDTLKRVAPKVPVVLRTRYLAERGALVGAGAHVVTDEVEAALAVLGRTLSQVGVAEEKTADLLAELRSGARPTT